jgi:MFS family permease
VMVVRFVPESPVKTASRVDVPGAVLLSGGLIALLVALSEGESWGWGSGRTLGLFAASLVVLVVWVRVELRVAEPLVDMHVFAQRPVLLTNLTALISGFAMFGTFVLIPNFVEMPHGLGATAARVVHYGFDASATKAGLYLLPSSIVLLAAGPVAGIVGRKTGMKWPLTVGLVLIALTSGSFAMFHDHPWQILVPMPFFGIGFGFAYAAMATLITEAVRPTETGIATGMNTVMRTVGGVVGGQMGAVLLSSYTIGRTGFPSVTGYEIAFALAAGASVVAAVLAVFVTPSRRMRRRRVAVAAAGRD